MTINDLIKWHKEHRDQAELNSENALFHGDAAALLGWCLELPSVGGEHAKSYAFETVAQTARCELKAIEMGLEEKFETLEDVETDRRFWRGVSRNVAEGIGARTPKPARLRLVR